MRYLDVPYFKQDTLYTCGPTSLQMVFSYYGIRESEAALKEELETSPETGTEHQQMINAVLKRGFHCYVNNDATLEDIHSLVERGVPTIVRFLETANNEDHYGVVVGVSSEEVVINDPWNGERVRFSHEDFMGRWKCDKLGDCTRWIMAISQEPFSVGHQYHPK